MALSVAMAAVAVAVAVEAVAAAAGESVTAVENDAAVDAHVSAEAGVDDDVADITAAGTEFGTPERECMLVGQRIQIKNKNHE